MNRVGRIAVLVVMLLVCVQLFANEVDNSPRPQERQLPFAMHSAMSQLPSISVGRKDCDLLGNNNLALQAAVDYIALQGGGTVTIGPGEYVMQDSLHLRSNVTVKGVEGKTVLQKAEGVVSPLVLDGDFGEQQFTVKDASGFEVGYGVTIRDDRSNYFHTTVARITGRNRNTFSIDKPLMADCMVLNNARAVTVSPVISGFDIVNARIEDLTIDGNKKANIHLNGCRGGGIFLYRAHGTIIENCTVRNYNGDGISFQQSNDVNLTGCVSYDNASLGLHPGSGSQRPVVSNCRSVGNGEDGLFLCWRVRHGLFRDNVLEKNGRFGISIGHKDSDNLIQTNVIRGNAESGIFFRNESLAMAAHRNRIVENIIENNGAKKPSAGIQITGHTNDLVFEGNVIRDTRTESGQTQNTGILIEENVGDVTLKDNVIVASRQIIDNRKSRK